MGQLVVRNLPDDVKDRLKRRAQGHGRSLEAEVRDILEQATREVAPQDAEKGFGSLMAERFGQSGLTEKERALIDEFSNERRARNRATFSKPRR